MMTRSQYVRLRYKTLENREKIINVLNSYAALIEHEIDHLNGMLLLERLSRKTRKQALRDIREQSLGLADRS